MRARFGAFNSPNGLFRSQSNKDNDTKNSMGNGPSVPEEITTTIPAGPQRLTKPRTNTNSTQYAVSRNDSDSNRSTPSKPSSRGATSAGEDRQLEPTGSPFSFYNESPLNLSVPGSASGLGNVYHHDSPSTSASNLSNGDYSPHASAKSLNRHSIAIDASDMDIGAAIALLQQLKAKATPEEIIALHKALLPTRSIDPDVETTIPETPEPEETISPLIRRASLLPAGLATRISLEAIKRRSSRKASQEKRRRSTSQVPRGRESGTWEQFAEGGFDALEPAAKPTVSRPGAATPSEVELTHIGNYRLGSLRITNGAASPEPSLILGSAEQAASVRTPSVSRTADGFVTAGEEDSSNEYTQYYDARAMKSPYPQKIRVSPGPKPSPGLCESRPMPKLRSIAPLQIDTVGHGVPSDAMEVPSRSYGRASAIAQEYAAECEPSQSPYSEGAPLATLASRLSTVEDNSPVLDDTFGGPEEALRKLNGGLSPNRSRQASGASDSSASRPDLDDHTHLQAPRRPSMQGKSDSGYSSETSWQAQAKAHIRGASVDNVLSTLAATNMAEQAWTRNVPPVATAMSRESLDDEVPTTAVTTPLAGLSGQYQPQSSESYHSLPNYHHATENMSRSTITPAHVTPAEHKPVKNHKLTKKLQKARPHEQLTAVQTADTVKTEIVPIVPENVSVNFSRRLVQRPGMAHLEQTFASVDQTDHKDMERSETGPADDVNQQGGDEEENRGRGRRQKLNVTSADPETPKSEKRKSFLSRLRSRSRSKSQHRSSCPAAVVGDDEPMPSISDFGTVAQSLGGSPYNIATGQTKSRQSSDGSRPRFHPHEITSEPFRPKVNMDDRTAAEFARMKSRDIAEQQAEDRRARSLSRSRRHVVDQISPSAARPKSKRSASAHPSIVPSVPTTSKHEDVPERPRPYRVGTIKFEGGEAQGRMSPVMMDRPKAARAARSSQTVSSRRRNVQTSESEEVGGAVEPTQGNLERPKPVRVGTIQFEGGEAQGRFSPTVMERPNVTRRTKSVSPRMSQTTDSAALPLQQMVAPEVPSLSRSKTTGITQPSTANIDVPASPIQNLADPTSWESHARLWRERKKSLGEALSPTTEKRRSHTGEITTPASEKRRSFVETALPLSPSAPLHYTPTEQAPRHSPAIVVSRYVTPTSEELKARIGRDDPYATYHSDNPTEHLPAKEDVDRTDSAISTSTYKTASSHRSHNPSTSRSTPNYQPYRPTNAVSMATLTSPPQQNRRSQFEPRTNSTATGRDVAFDRYSGGLGYGWEGRGVGFGGSAGMRQGSDQTAKRRSVQLSESFGVDLSDVPVFLTR